jgi:hypothetical protein
MKTKSIFTIVLFAVLGIAALFTSCNKEPENNPSIRFDNVNTLRQTVFADEIIAPQVIQFTTTAAWTSSISTMTNSQLKGGEPDWVIITPNKGNAAGNYTVSIILGVNATGEDRSAVIMLTVGSSLVSITITQKGTTATGTIPTTPTFPTIPTEPNNPTNPTNPTDPTLNMMTGKLNGTAFTWNGDAGVIDDLIFLEASSEAEFPSIMLSIPLNVTVGKSYTLTADGDYSAFFITEDDYTDIESGTLTVTEHNTEQKTIKGTFSFTTGTYVVTEGTFNYNYLSEDDVQAESFIKAKVNGDDYSATAASISVDGGMGAKISVGSLIVNDSKPAMSVSFPEGTSIGTYTITGDVFGDYGALYNNIRATSGIITITSFDPTTLMVKGTFSFVAGEYIVTNGEFEAELPE